MKSFTRLSLSLSHSLFRSHSLPFHSSIRNHINILLRPITDLDQKYDGSQYWALFGGFIVVSGDCTMNFNLIMCNYCFDETKVKSFIEVLIQR